MTSVLAVIDNIPGVLINEGDTFGSDDWSTTVSIRGFQISLDEQQVGITVDGIANGNSNYGGGAKANRYIDTENLKGVEVSQGTSDIASRSNEGLGGTLNFTTIDPEDKHSVLFSATQGSFDAHKYFTRVNTGDLGADTRAWFSISSSQSSDWMQQAAENTRDHFAAKLVSEQDIAKITAYVSYDDVHEDNYQRVTLDQFAQNPQWDGLTDEWTGNPYVDQVYRRGWSTLRENTFAYLSADFQVATVDVHTNVYYHHNKGRGDWIPPYLVDVTDDQGGSESELVSGNTVYGGSALGSLYFVDANGNALTADADCTSSITFPYGGAGAEYDAACYASNAIPVGSYRHTHYKKERKGFNLDASWMLQLEQLENTVRGGMWIEDYQRDESRDWHKIIDSEVGYEYDHTPYWVQYDRSYPVDTTMFYLEDTLVLGDVAVRVGAKKFLVDLERNDNFTAEHMDVNSDSDTLLSAGLVWHTPLEGLELFTGYAENFAAIKDEVLERDASALTDIAPETADNLDVGIRYNTNWLSASLTWYSIDFDNRLTYISADSDAGIDYLVGTNGAYINTGGIESEGIEAAVNIEATDALSVYISYTNNDSTYVDGSVSYPAGNTVFGSVEEMAVVSLDWQQDNLSTGLSNKYVGKRWMDPANSQRIDDYLVSDLYIGAEFEKPGLPKLSLRLTVNNLFDKRYIGGVAGGWGGWLGAARTTSLQLSGQF